MFSPRELRNRMQGPAGGAALLPPDASVCVAFSGGLDSTVLLHSFARLAAEPGEYRVRAVHIDHGLHSASTLWRDQCEREAQARDVPRGRVLKDDVLGDIATQAPTSLERRPVRRLRAGAMRRLRAGLGAT